MSDAEQDSVVRSNPEYMFQADPSSERVLAILNRSGIGNKDELFLDKIAFSLKDTIIIVDNKASLDSVWIVYDKTYGKAVIQIKDAQSTDNIPIKDEAFSHTFKLVKLKSNEEPYLVFVNQYYIMNGDNYEVSVYEKSW